MNVETQTILCRNCRTSCDTEHNFCPRCGERLRGASTVRMLAAPAVATPTTPETPTAPSPTTSSGKREPLPRWLVLSLASAMLVIGLGALAVSLLRTAQATSITNHAQAQPEGIVWFYNAHKQNDAIAFRLRALPALAKGNVYVLWLVNPRRPDQQMAIGPLTPDKNGSISFASDHKPAFNPLLLDLRMVFTNLQLTVEHTATRFLHPQGQLVLQGKLAPGSLDGITLVAPD